VSTADPRADTALIRRRLKRAWTPFFSRFGSLTEIQLRAIPLVLDDANVVLASPTASGKTEAIVAPVAERCGRPSTNTVAVLYVVPTRALANDTLLRIEGPLSDLGMRVRVKHGDQPTLPRLLPHWLVTTPESLDSLICRRPAVFADLQAVILDEIHLLDGTYRGDQLRILLRRLRHLSKEPFATHLLSATLADPSQVGERYVDDFEVITVAGQRPIERSFVSSLEEVRVIARAAGHKKLLVFCNRRESVETLAAQLAAMWRPYPVVAHHGSLSRDERKEAEQVMQEEAIAVCVATSTLEIGIDIGDIDLVVLAEPPFSVSALLQRIGRGNRRSAVTRAIAIVQSDDERALVAAMFDAAASGALPAPEYRPDISVVVQQIFSLLYTALTGMEEAKLYEVVSPLCEADALRMILAHLNESEWVVARHGLWFPSTKLLDQGERGWIHSNIPDSGAYRVIDVSSGREVGRIAGVFDRVFVLARRSWQVVSIEHDIVRARPFRGAASSAMFRRSRTKGAFFSHLPAALQSADEAQ